MSERLGLRDPFVISKCDFWVSSSLPKQRAVRGIFDAW